MVETTNSKVRRQKKEKMEICNSTEDRISQLPDSLILHILSYLDIRYVIQTISLLSKRWKPLWTSLSNLKFSDTDFFSRGIEWISRFIQFVDTVLLLRDSSDIKKFFLSCSYPEWETRKTHIYTWILIAVRRNVQELLIRLPEEFNFHFPPSIFTCTSLTSLFINNFDGDITEHNLNPMNLPKLKILILWGIIVDQNLTNKIFSSCPSLETLIWDFASVKDSDKSFIISAPKLKHLSLQKVQYSMKNEAVTVTLNAPKLTSFSCKDVSEQDYNLDSFDCLETANIEMSLIEQPTDFLHLPLSLRELYAPRLMNFLRAIHNVKDLTISSGCLEVMMGVPDSVHSPPTQFRNLRRLKFDVWLTRASFRAITYLLQISPNIEYLSMEVYGVNIDDEYFYYVDAISRKNLEYWDEGTSLPCILSHLKFVKIQGLVGCVNELKFLNFLLKNSVVLQKLDLFEGYSPKLSVPKRRLKKFKKTLLSFPRASEAANDMIQFKF